MRFNRNTIILIVVSVLVIGGLIVFQNVSNNEDIEPTPSAQDAESVDLFADVSLDDIESITLSRVAPPDPLAPPPSEDATEEPDAEPDVDVLTLTQGESPTWTVSEVPDRVATDRALDENLVIQRVTEFAALTSADRFPVEENDPADFGLTDDNVTTITAVAGDETLTVVVGNQNTSGNRFYAFVDGDTETIHQIPTGQLTQLLDWVDFPPYVPAPTPTPTMPPTLNPLSEVEQATATAEFMATFEAELEAAGVAVEETPEATPEATDEPDAEETPEATEEPEDEEETDEE